MDSLKFHQLLNYYPAIGMVLAALLLAVGLGRGSESARRYGLRLVFAVALLTLVVVFTGEFASWDTPLYQGTRGEALAQHRLIGTVAFAIVEIAGIAALTALLRSGRYGRNGRAAAMIAFVLTVVASVLLVTVIFRGRQVKWAVIDPGPQPAVVRSIEMEKQLWHA